MLLIVYDDDAYSYSSNAVHVETAHVRAGMIQHLQVQQQTIHHIEEHFLARVLANSSFFFSLSVLCDLFILAYLVTEYIILRSIYEVWYFRSCI